MSGADVLHRLADTVMKLPLEDIVNMAPRWFCSDEVSAVSGVEPAPTDPDSDADSRPFKRPRLLSHPPPHTLPTPASPPASIANTMTTASFASRPLPLLEAVGRIPTSQASGPAQYPTQTPASTFRIVGPPASASGPCQHLFPSSRPSPTPENIQAETVFSREPSQGTPLHSTMGSSEKDASTSMAVHLEVTSPAPLVSWGKLTTPDSPFTSPTPSREPTPPPQPAKDPKPKPGNARETLPSKQRTRGKVGGRVSRGGHSKKPTGNGARRERKGPRNPNKASNESEDEAQLAPENLDADVVLRLFEKLEIHPTHTPSTVERFVPSHKSGRSRTGKRREPGLRTVILYDGEGNPVSYLPCMYVRLFDSPSPLVGIDPHSSKTTSLRSTSSTEQSRRTITRVYQSTYRNRENLRSSSILRTISPEFLERN